MEHSRVVRETTEYEDGTIEERILRRRDDEEKEYEAPSSGMGLGVLLVLGGIGLFLLWKYKDFISTQLSNTVLTGGDSVINKDSVIYKAETPRPMVGVDEYVATVGTSGRAIR